MCATINKNGSSKICIILMLALFSACEPGLSRIIDLPAEKDITFHEPDLQNPELLRNILGQENLREDPSSETLKQQYETPETSYGFDKLPFKKRRCITIQGLANLDTSTKMTFLPYYTISAGLSKIALTLPEENATLLTNSTRNEIKSYLIPEKTTKGRFHRISTRSNLSTNNLMEFHKLLIKGFEHFCPEVAAEYMNMLGIVDEAIERKIEQVKFRLRPTSITDTPFKRFLRNVTNCHHSFEESKNNPKVSLEVEVDEEDIIPMKENKPTSPRAFIYAEIRKRLNEEGKIHKAERQLDIVPSTINLARFEKLCLRMVTIFCSKQNHQQQKYNEELKKENHRSGSLLLSAIEFNKLIPKATLHQTEMEEMVNKTKECIKKRDEYNYLMHGNGKSRGRFYSIAI